MNRVQLKESYESPQQIERMENWYNLFKEESFIKFIFSKIPIDGDIIELGAGTGTHGKILQGWTKSYMHSDFSFNLCKKAKFKNLKTICMDALNISLKDNSVDNIVAISLSTLLYSQNMRMAQFKEFFRLIKNNGYLIICVPHSFNRKLYRFKKSDTKKLEKIGFKKVVVFHWGIIPGRFWNKANCSLFTYIERTISAIHFGIRLVIILQK